MGWARSPLAAAVVHSVEPKHFAFLPLQNAARQRRDPTVTLRVMRTGHSGRRQRSESMGTVKTSDSSSAACVQGYASSTSNTKGMPGTHQAVQDGV